MYANYFYSQHDSDIFKGKFKVNLQNIVSMHDKFCRIFVYFLDRHFLRDVFFPWFTGAKRYVCGFYQKWH
jgi:hypothetical protein